MGWESATIAEVKRIIETDLARCDDEQIAVFKRYSVEPHFWPILRHGKIENVVVIAQRQGEVIYWEDVEEGFNVSAVDINGRIHEHRCNQDELRLALNAWIEGRAKRSKLSPAKP